MYITMKELEKERLETNMEVFEFVVGLAEKHPKLFPKEDLPMLCHNVTQYLELYRGKS